MDMIQEKRSKIMDFQGKAIFMVHLKQEKSYWEGIVPPSVEVRTSHSLGHRAIKQVYRIIARSANELKVAYTLDRLIPDEPDTASQRERLMQLLDAILQRRADKVIAPTQRREMSQYGAEIGKEASVPGYRDVVITLTVLAKKEACRPHDITAIDAVLGRFTPYYNVFRTKLDKLDRNKVLACAGQALELSLPKDGVLDEYDFADQIWLPAIHDEMPLEEVDTLFIQENPGFYEAEKRLVSRWRRNGANIIEVVPERSLGGG